MTELTPSGRSALRKCAALVAVTLSVASVGMFIAAIWVNSEDLSAKLMTTAVVVFMFAGGAFLYYEHGGLDA